MEKKKIVKKKPGRKRAVLSKAKIIKAICNDIVNPYTNSIAKYYKVSWITMDKFLQENIEIIELMEKRKREIVEKAEEVITEILNNPEDFNRAGIAKWVLTQRNKNYKDKQELDISGGIEIIIKDAKITDK
jgi:hypothetical protein